jgi:hypothetical protein
MLRLPCYHLLVPPQIIHTGARKTMDTISRAPKRILRFQHS